uniref:Uncharacterized protein n=1 Tax=Avena sativa TaxID=4498 RepID=A0ACD5UXQ8_AVESA
MDRSYQGRLSLLAAVLLTSGAVLAVLAASPATGETTAALAGGMGVVNAAAALRQLTPDVHRRILVSVSNSVLDPNRPACIGTCGGAGQAYTGRGCQSAYQCRQR